MNIRFMGGLVLASAFLVSSQAMAACRVAGGNFFPNQNDSVTYYATSDNGKCNMNYRAGGGTEFTSSSIARQPQNGTLKQTAPFGFSYAAKSGFKGSDQYVIKVCANSQGRSGCSTLTYQMTVE